MDPTPIEIPQLSGIKIKIKMTDAVPDSWMKMFRLPEFTISNIEKIICGIDGACRKNNPDNIQYIFINYGPGGNYGPDGPGGPYGPGRNSKEPNPDSSGYGPGGPYGPGRNSKEPNPDSSGTDSNGSNSKPGSNGSYEPPGEPETEEPPFGPETEEPPFGP